MLVGKTGHGPSCRQDDINTLMVRLAKSGKHVVRLKGGDPMVFGRAGEENFRLPRRRHPGRGDPPASRQRRERRRGLCASLTHRDHARRLQYVTGHDRSGALPDLDWTSLADPFVTTVVYMPTRTLATLAAKCDRSRPRSGDAGGCGRARHPARRGGRRRHHRDAAGAGRVSFTARPGAGHDRARHGACGPRRSRLDERKRRARGPP